MAEVNLIGGGSTGGTVTTGGAGLPPSNCRNLEMKKEGTQVSLKWTDPQDTVIDGQYLCSWGGTMIVRKAGSYPASSTDGTLIKDSKVRDAHFAEALVDELPDTENEYFYRAFPYSVNGVVNLDTHNAFGAVIYGFYIDTLDPNPATRVHYIEDNEYFKPAKMNFSTGLFDYGDWADAWFIRNLRPCMLKNDGTVDYELYEYNYALKKDGEPSDIANASYNGNAMIGIPQVWLKYVKVGTRFYVYIANKQVDSAFKAYAHINNNGDLLDEIFLPIYEGSLISGKLRSLSGQRPESSTTSEAERNAAVANGEGWFTGVLADWLLIQMLTVLIGRTTDSQGTFGNGHYSGGTQASHLHTTGALNTKGLFWGSSGNEGIKMFGQENATGDRWERIAGWINVSGTQKIKLTYGTEDGSTATGYNETGSGYIAIGAAPSGTSGGYISKAALTQWGIFPCEASGSSSTFYCDGLWFNNGQTDYALVGGACSYGSLVGAFASYLDNVPSRVHCHLGASLSCKPLL